jgi:hypothetical protein
VAEVCGLKPQVTSTAPPIASEERVKKCAS